MEWPSKNVPRGGILHPAKASYSPETHQLLNGKLFSSLLSALFLQLFSNIIHKFSKKNTLS